jgi:hypothetical protein
MARLILHARYFAPNAKKRQGRLSYLVKYYGTREGVEKPQAEEWKKNPVTEKQDELIQKLLDDIPEITDTHEWEDYKKNPNQGNASELIRWGAEHQMQSGNPDIYLRYIAERPRVEKVGNHGLFSQHDEEIDLGEVAKTVSEHPGNVWTMVFSLHRQDAERLSYNNAESWRTICRAKSGLIAKAMRIPEKDFQWYAAFHNEGHHPHIHMVAYSTGVEGYLTKFGIDDIKRAFAHEIFRMDLQQVYEQQTQLRNDLRQMAKEYLKKLRELPKAVAELQSLIPVLTEIKHRLPTKGKLKYGYMPRDVKNLVDEAVDRLEKNPKVAELYDLWYKQKCAIIQTYTNNFPPKEPLSENETFRDIKNAVLMAAKEMGDTIVLKTMNETESNESCIQIEVNELNELEQTLERIQREHGTEEAVHQAENEAVLPSFRSIESFLYRVSKVFEDKRPIGDQGQVMDKKAYVRQVEHKRELGMQ